MRSMGRFDDITPDMLRADLRHFADLIRRLDDDDRLLEATPHLLKVLGDLRAKIFAHEVRATGQLLAKRAEDDEKGQSRRIVEEAIRRIEEAAREWNRPWDTDPKD